MRTRVAVVTACCFVAVACTSFGTTAPDTPPDAGALPDAQTPLDSAIVDASTVSPDQSSPDQSSPDQSSPDQSSPDAGACEIVRDNFDAPGGVDPRWSVKASSGAGTATFTGGKARLSVPATRPDAFSVLSSPAFSRTAGAAYEPEHLEASFRMAIDTSTLVTFTVMQVPGLFTTNLSAVVSQKNNLREISLQFGGRFSAALVIPPGTTSFGVNVVLVREAGTDLMTAKLEVDSGAAKLDGLTLAPNPGRGLGYFQIGPFTNFGAADVAIDYDDADMRRCGP